MATHTDPLVSVRAALARAEGAPSTDPATLDPAIRAELEAALATIDAVRASGTSVFDVRRALVHRSAVLSLLGRRADAAAAYAEALGLDLENGEELLEGLRELLDSFGALETVLTLVPKAIAAHPGRRWQFAPLADLARTRLALERTAPLSTTDLARLRDEVGKRLSTLPPCDHADDRRPVARAVARDLGFDEAVILVWLADLGACCCDCAVARVCGPREPRA